MSADDVRQPEPPAEIDFDAELEAELEACDQLYRDALADLFRVPSGLLDRTRTEVGEALLGRSTLLAGIDLLGTGWRTARLLFGPPPGAADPPETRPHYPFPSPIEKEHP